MLALIAGEGQLPKILMEDLDRREISFRLCEVEGFASEGRADRPVVRFRIETLGSFLRDLNEFGIDQVCFVGRVARPKLDPTLVDEATMPLVPRILSALQAGDDGALRAVLSFFEETGITVVAAHEILPNLIPKSGVYSALKPDAQVEKDAMRGAEIIRAISAVDIGQGCIVANGQALAVEAIGGTDWMMRSLMRAPDGIGRKFTTETANWTDPLGLVADYMSGTGEATKSYNFVRDPNLPEKGLLLKAAKKDQDMRVDVPAIGPQTLLRAAQVDLQGVVVEAGRVMVIDLEECTRIADANGLILWVRD